MPPYILTAGAVVAVWGGGVGAVGVGVVGDEVGVGDEVAVGELVVVVEPPQADSSVPRTRMSRTEAIRTRFFFSSFKCFLRYWCGTGLLFQSGLATPCTLGFPPRYLAAVSLMATPGSTTRCSSSVFWSLVTLTARGWMLLSTASAAAVPAASPMA